MGEWIWLVAGLSGFVLAWAAQGFRMAAKARSALDLALAEQAGQHEEKVLLAMEKLAQLERDNAALAERSRFQEESLLRGGEDLSKLRGECADLNRALASSQERARSKEERLEAQKRELEAMQQKLTADFEILATRALDANASKFAAQNKESLDKLLLPLAEKIGSFRERVERSHEQGIKDRASLMEQLRQLGELNQRMSEEARNLTTALKGQAKTQGSWGELILETVLEKSGLVAGREYVTQVSSVGEDGKRYQPDVIVNLPDSKCLVIDAKVSLVAYERSVNAVDAAEREAALKDHLKSIRNHVAELGKKRYDALPGISSPDFVLMFIPVESAFSLAAQADDTLFDAAFRDAVVLVTPSTLLATLRTVSNVWRQEKQTRNALEIATRGGALYDKFVGFVGDMEEIGLRLSKSREAYEAAMSKLQGGKGNLLRQVEDLKELGAKAKKSLPSEKLEALED